MSQQDSIRTCQLCCVLGLAAASGCSFGIRSPSASKGNSSGPPDLLAALSDMYTAGFNCPLRSCCCIDALEVLAEGASSAMSRSIPSAAPSKRGSDTPLTAVFLLPSSVLTSCMFANGRASPVHRACNWDEGRNAKVILH